MPGSPHSPPQTPCPTRDGEAAAERQQSMTETSMTVSTEAESVFTYGSPNLKFGPGASDEIGFDLSQIGAKRALVVTDPGISATGLPQRVADAMGQYGIEAQVFDGVHVEPTDESLQEAID